MTTPEVPSAPEWPTIVVTPWERTDAVMWLDGKPRCTKHRVCLVSRYAVGLHGPGHHCPRCMREQRDALEDS